MTDRRERKRQETRTALLDSALALVKQRGIYGTRVEDITERADVGKGVFYNYFDSKDAIVAALLADGVELLQREYLASGAEAASDSTARIRHVVEAHERFFLDHPEFSLLFHQARGVLQLGQTSVAQLRSVFEAYLRYIAEAVAPAVKGQSELPQSAKDVAAVVAGAIAGFRSFCHAAGQEQNTEVLIVSLTSGLPRDLG